jgi:hypothetical protein
MGQWENESGTKSRRHGIATPVDKLVAMTTILVLILICLIGSALLGFRGYWS